MAVPATFVEFLALRSELVAHQGCHAVENIVGVLLRQFRVEVVRGRAGLGAPEWASDSSGFRDGHLTQNGMGI
jgi:hypothetical protein